MVTIWEDPSTEVEKKDHQKRHQILHSHLDELLADYLWHHYKALPSKITCEMLMKWSKRQTESTSGLIGKLHNL